MSESVFRCFSDDHFHCTETDLVLPLTQLVMPVLSSLRSACVILKQVVDDRVLSCWSALSGPSPSTSVCLLRSHLSVDDLKESIARGERGLQLMLIGTCHAVSMVVGVLLKEVDAGAIAPVVV